jgi:hypothetical protein
MMAGFGGREVTLDSVREIVNRSRRALDAGRVPADEAQFIGLKPELLPAQERGDRARTV